MLKVVVIMNTAMEEIFSKKCCAYHDMNLEIQVRNEGSSPVKVPSYCDFEGRGEIERIEYLMPHGVHLLQPGEAMSFYCSFDEHRWESVRKVVFYDNDGNPYGVEIQS